MPALVTQRTQISRSALGAAVGTAEENLRHLGVRPGQRVGLCGSNTVEHVCILLALAHLDCSIVPIDMRGFRSADEVAAVARLDLVILPRGCTEAAWTSAQGVSLLTSDSIITMPPGEITRWTAPGAVALDLDGVETWPWCQRSDGLVQVTSGSTGTPKLVAKTPGHALSNMRRTHEVLRYRPDDVLAPVLPMSHQYGLSILLGAVLLNLTLVLSPAERVRDAMRLARRAGVTVVDATPQTHDAILHEITLGRLPASLRDEVRYWCVGGGPVSDELQRRAFHQHGQILLDGYGSTELGNIAHVRPEDPAVLRPLPGIELAVKDPEGRPQPSGTWGELWVATPDAQDTSPQRTGDLACLTAEGGLRVAGRAEAVSRNGLLIYPAALERELAEAGVPAVCIATEMRGRSRLTLVIEDRLRRRRDEWQRRVEAVLPPALAPDRLIVQDQLPRTPVSGKIDRRTLRDLVLARTEPRQAGDLVTRALPDAPPNIGERVAALARVAEDLRTHRETWLDLMTPYSTRSAATIELSAAVAALEGAAGEMVVQRPPRIPTSWVHMPSNILVYSYVLYLLVPSLFTDEIVARPSSRATEATWKIHERMRSVHGLNINMVASTQTELCDLRGERPGTLVFTGRFANAEKVRETLRPGQLMLFFGQGTNPVVVGPEADVEVAASESVSMRLLNGGQDCFGPDLHLVHRDVAEQFLSRVTDRLAQLDPAEHRTSDAADILTVVDHVSQHHKNICFGGAIDLGRMLVSPTILTWPATSAPECSEVFAPIFNIAVYDSEEEVREILGATFYRERSMCAALYGTSEALATWCSELMTVSVDCAVVSTDDPNQPFGGVGRIANYWATTEEVVAEPLLVSATVRRHLPQSTLPAADADRARLVTV